VTINAARVCRKPHTGTTHQKHWTGARARL